MRLGENGESIRTNRSYGLAYLWYMRAYFWPYFLLEFFIVRKDFHFWKVAQHRYDIVRISRRDGRCIAKIFLDDRRNGVGR